MKYSKLLLLFLTLSAINANAMPNHVIMFMGPSCAGKSTLSKYVCAKLNAINKDWMVIDFDEVEENIELLITATNECLKKNINVIIDTNTYEDEMEKKFEGAVTIIKILVTAPLDILLKRDKRRTEGLQRDEQRAYQCRSFVISSFHESFTWPFDLLIDSAKQSLEEACIKVLSLIKINLMENPMSVGDDLGCEALQTD